MYFIAYRPCSSRTHLRSYVYFAKEFLCSHTLSFFELLELEWWLPRNFFINCTVFKHADNKPPSIRLPRFDAVWVSQAEPSFPLHLLAKGDGGGGQGEWLWIQPSFCESKVQFIPTEFMASRDAKSEVKEPNMDVFSCNASPESQINTLLNFLNVCWTQPYTSPQDFIHNGTFLSRNPQTLE